MPSSSNADQQVFDAVTALAAGEVIGLPTETVYGLGADATNSDAVAKIYALKERPRFNPLIVHVPSLQAARSLIELDPLSESLMTQFSPGPLTLIGPCCNPSISDLVTAGLETLAVRIPSHPIALEILHKFAKPVAAPSANKSGKISPTKAQDVTDAFGDTFLSVEGGASPVGLESTIVRIMDDKIHLLRPGAITADMLETASGKRVVRPQADTTIIAPGQLQSHYAPNAKLVLNAQTASIGAGILDFGRQLQTASHCGAYFDLSPTASLEEAATNLFAALRTLDSKCELIMVAPIPATGLGEAILDRLTRAAAPKMI